MVGLCIQETKNTFSQILVSFALSRGQTFQNVRLFRE